MENFINDLAGFVWTWNVPILVGSGIFFLIYSKLTPFKYLKHAFELILGKHSKKDDVGEVTHFQALTTALSGTIGLGNIAGVAIAIQLAGPGTIFWMWLTAVVGIATKFFTCTLSVMYRDVGEDGTVRGGPMYVIKNALPSSMIPLAYFFAAAGLIGALPGFQSNQLVQIMGDLPIFQFENFNLIAGIILAGVFNSGVLIKGVTKDSTYDYAKIPNHIIEKYNAINEVCNDFNVPIAAAAIQFSNAHSAISTLLLGMDYPEQVQENLNLFNFKIEKEFWLTLLEKKLIDPESPIPE